MKKKLIMLGSILLLAGCFMFSSYLKNMSFSLLNQVSAQKAEEIKAVRTENAVLDFSCLLCNDMRVPFDAQGKTFYVSVDMEENTWESLDFMSGQPEYNVLFLEDIIKYNKKETISQGRKIPVLVYNDTEYASYYIAFSGLPLIDLTTDVGMWQENIEGTVVFYDTDFTVNGVKESSYNAHLRGNTSRMYPKKGYKLNLVKNTASGTVVNNKQAVFGMREDDDWILYAMYNDESKIRDRLCIDIWNEFGAKAVSEKSTYGTNLTYVEVFADNSYCGLYGLMEPVDAKQLNLSAADYLYKRKNPSGLVYEDFLVATDPYEMVHGFEIKEGVMNEKAWEPMTELSYLVYHTSEEEFAKTVSNYMDEDSAMRMWLFIQIITGHDQRAKNVFYVARQEEEGYRFYFAPWDMDLTWGNVSVGEVNPLYTDFEWETYDDDIPWETADRMIFSNVNGAADNMQELYKQLRKTILSDKQMEERISDLDNQLRASGAYERDRERWPEGAHTDDYKKLLNYAKLRLKFLDSALFDLQNYD